jgi:hypothetical protein
MILVVDAGGACAGGVVVIGGVSAIDRAAVSQGTSPGYYGSNMHSRPKCVPQRPVHVMDGHDAAIIELDRWLHTY